jgi:hypothetical protein
MMGNYHVCLFKGVRFCLFDLLLASPCNLLILTLLVSISLVKVKVDL